MTAPAYRITAVPDVIMPDGSVMPGGTVLLPDGSVLPGPLAGSQMPRFWTAPQRHRQKDPGCAACGRRGYRGGCGNYAAEELLDWAPAYGYNLDVWQQWWLTEACGVRPDGRWAAFEVSAVCSRQNGKNDQDLTTRILTQQRGWVTFADIAVGDMVYGSGGQPTSVVAKTEVFTGNACYEVSFTDGSSYVVGEGHLWQVRHKDRGGWHPVRTRDLAEDVGGRRSGNGRMEYNWRVRCDAVVQTPPAELPVDPYLLGFWLGDGDSTCARLFAGKTDLDWVEGIIATAGGTITDVREHPVTKVQEVNFRLAAAWSRDGFRSRLGQLGILGAGRKRIPELYLTASPAQRLALLRGLMDSDGSIAITNKTPQVEFTTTLPGLADDFWRLARSLGIRVTRRDGPSSLDGVRHKDRARFLWTPAVNPFAMPRKAERWRPPVSRRHEVMSITGIRPVPSVSTRCIQVAADDGVYLVGKTFTPTHNSMLEVRELGGLFVFGESMIIHTAHEFKAAAEHFRRVRDTIASYDDLSRRVKRVMTSHGDEAIELRPAPTLIFGPGGKRIRRNIGGRLRFLARSRGSGRSFTADCFSGDTRYWTRDGLKTLAETAGTTQDVLANAGSGYGGAWCKAEIRSFGARQLWAVTLRRNKQVKVIRATAGHRWFVRDSRDGKPPRELLTSDLRPGHKLAWQLPKTKIWHSTPSQFGIAHGVVFGDGSRDQWGSKVELWGAKTSLLPYFSESPQRGIRTPNGVPGISVRGLPFFFKDLPSLSESVPYLYGWLAGYFAADGNVTAQGLAQLSSVSRENLEFVQLLATRLGIGTYRINSSVTNGSWGGEPVTGYKIQFVSSTLRPEFFLKAEHQERYVTACENRSRNDRLGWTVVSAELTGEVEEVFCAVVPEHQNFVLEDWIRVGNCVVYDEAMFLTDDQVGASMPTMSAVANPQMIYTASAGYHDSVQLALVRRRILKHDPTLMGAEWSISPHTDSCPRDEVIGRKANRYVVCERHDDRDDPRSWAKANPAFGGRISYEHISKEFAAMSPAAFDRERLGVGDWPEESESWSVISEEAWGKCSLPDPGGAVRPLAFAVDIDPAMNVSTIAAAWSRPEPDGSTRTVLEIPRGCSREGTGWVVQRLTELRSQWRPIGICFPRNGPAAGLADAAENAGLEVVRATSGDEAEAFSQMITAIRNQQVRHLGREQAPGLWSAIASAETRQVGDGGQAWSRRESESDITPIVAATLAAWALGKKRRNYDPRRSVALGVC